jgi:hypothetical protein
VCQHEGVAIDTVCYEYLESHGLIIITQHLLSEAALPNDDARGRGQWWGLEKKHLMRRYGERMLGLAVIAPIAFALGAVALDDVDTGLFALFGSFAPPLSWR